VNVLGVFAKHWTPGAVKTRLAASVGPEAAARLARAFLDCTLERFRTVGHDRVLAYWPPEQASAFAPYETRGWRLAPQSPGDLGARMKRYFDDAFARGAGRVVLIGADSPTLPVSYVEQAFAGPASNDVALGPTSDGGYYLVGAAGGTPPIFDGVAWSTPEVWRQTTARLAKARTPFAVLPEWYDVDEADDLRRLARELERLVEEDDAWRPLWEEVQHCSIV
jgi:uncharacterized protein